MFTIIDNIHITQYAGYNTFYEIYYTCIMIVN